MAKRAKPSPPTVEAQVLAALRKAGREGITAAQLAMMLETPVTARQRVAMSENCLAVHIYKLRRKGIAVERTVRYRLVR